MVNLGKYPIHGWYGIGLVPARVPGSLVVADFCWKNVAGATGKGKWLVMLGFESLELEFWHFRLWIRITILVMR